MKLNIKKELQWWKHYKKLWHKDISEESNEEMDKVY